MEDSDYDDGLQIVKVEALAGGGGAAIVFHSRVSHDELSFIIHVKLVRYLEASTWKKKFKSY